ncbi:hypothetical protein XM38_022270 [Halomicronema hongdechloris C2206]|uniref:Uncharacterized protein n=2 Tax=Halomicronema hongdechloris TaxID=1209493 RepID=A0A1Z3HLX1_9CYAN|nr:hypothetical protein XM38_022270 [Halomicronema hongdechloris C2206]
MVNLIWDKGTGQGIDAVFFPNAWLYGARRPMVTSVMVIQATQGRSCSRQVRLTKS